MYDFHYNLIKKEFDVELLFTDTDSLIYEIKPENAYKEFYKWKDLFYFSNYSKDSKFFDESIKNIKYYGLDPCHHFTSLGLSWDAMLKMTGIKLEKISDIDMYLFIEKRTRGGVSYIAKRYTKANINYMDDYDKEKPSTFITYLDENNLYRWAMSESLPYGEFRCVKNVDGFDVMSISEESDTRYLLKVNLEYADELHELHNDYPLALETLAVSNDMLSAYCKKLLINMT